MRMLRSRTRTTALVLSVLALACAAPVVAGPRMAAGVPASVAVAFAGAGHWELGAVTDVRRAGADGVVVLAVTPGGAAERMGLRVGDQLRAVNGITLVDALQPNQVLGDALANSNGKAVLGVVRDRRQMTLSGTLDGDRMTTRDRPAAAAGCGFLSANDAPPRVTERIFDGEITMIDGDSTPLRPDNRYRVTPGRHVVVVREQIDAHRLTAAQRQQIALLKRREIARVYKALVVDVAPGMRYSIGAKLHKDRLDTDSIRANAYWEPVVFRSTPEACR